jgi:hypothetical protein
VHLDGGDCGPAGRDREGVLEAEIGTAALSWFTAVTISQRSQRQLQIMVAAAEGSGPGCRFHFSHAVPGNSATLRIAVNLPEHPTVGIPAGAVGGSFGAVAGE